MYMESKYWSWRNIIQLEALQVWWFIILIDSVREYEKTGLEGVSGSGLVPDCCHIVATIYCSGMDNHCVIFTIFLDHDLCILWHFAVRQRQQHECQMQISLCKTLRNGQDSLVRRAFRAEDRD